MYSINMKSQQWHLYDIDLNGSIYEYMNIMNELWKYIYNILFYILYIWILFY